jgi:hypothetical protein
MLAGVSPEWYTWLEQERQMSVSVQLLESLARVLQLDANERDHLFLLALRQPPPVENFSPPTVSPTLQQFLNQLGTSPTCVVDSRLNIVARNKAHSAVFSEHTELSELGRNLIWILFTSPWSLQVNQKWDEIARVYLAQFRASYGRYIKDPWWATQIAELSKVSPKFREMWARHDVQNISEGHKNMHHPLVGELNFSFLWLQTVESQDLRLLIHTPCSNTETTAKIERLLANTFED